MAKGLVRGASPPELAPPAFLLRVSVGEGTATFLTAELRRAP